MIEYKQLTANNFHMCSLDNFKRRQHVTECWRYENGQYVLKPVDYTEDWSLHDLRDIANRILHVLKQGYIAYGATYADEMIGFALIDNRLFGSLKQYADLSEFYVSETFRRQGIGGKLFNLACEGAKKLGAKKLYISAHSAKDVISAYTKYGCNYAVELNAALTEKEPYDLQLEFILK